MKKSFLNKLLLVIVLFSALGCKTRKAVVRATPQKEPAAESPAVPEAAVISNIKAKQIAFNTLAIRAKADLAIDKNRNDVSMNIRIKNGETIWISVTALAGIEVARALITPDSIRVMNRIQSEYTKKPFSFIHQFSNQQVDFNTVQALFTANVIPGALNGNPSLDVANGKAQISGNLSGIVYHLIFNTDYNLIQNSLQDQVNERNLVVNYSNFQKVGEQEIPHEVTMSSVAADKSLSLALKYHQVTINEALDFPFNVPKRFTVKN